MEQVVSFAAGFALGVGAAFLLSGAIVIAAIIAWMASGSH